MLACRQIALGWWWYMPTCKHMLPPALGRILTKRFKLPFESDICTQADIYHRDNCCPLSLSRHCGTRALIDPRRPNQHKTHIFTLASYSTTMNILTPVELQPRSFYTINASVNLPPVVCQSGPGRCCATHCPIHRLSP